MPLVFRHIILPAILLLLLLTGNSSGYAQEQFAFRISFTDKQYNPADTLSKNTWLHTRALERRNKQGLAIDSTDAPVVQDYIDSVLQISKGVVHMRSRWLNHIVLLMNTDTVSVSSIRSCSFVKDVTWIAKYASPLHDIRKSNPDAFATTDAGGEPKALFRSTSDVGYYGDAYEQIAIAGGQSLHHKGWRGAGMLIAVIDEGFHMVNTLAGYDSLRMRGGIKDTYNFNLDTADVYGYSSHGTIVLSTMAGILKSLYVGTAPDADYALYITEASLSEQPIELDNMLAALERADSIGADIATISLGYNGFTVAGIDKSLSYIQLDGHSTIVAQGANMATKKGMLIVASAGNDGATPWKHILTPGDADSALTCGSVDVNKYLASTSGRGPNASGRLKPDVCMMGAPGVVLNNTGTTSSVGGTSIATPQLAGLAACLWQGNPAWTPYQIRDAVRLSAHMAATPDNNYGYGVPDFSKVRTDDTIPICICLPPDIYILPNPGNGLFALRYTGTDIRQYEWAVYDMLGKRILSGQSDTRVNEPINMPVVLPDNIASGVYILQFRSDVRNQNIRFLKE